VLTPTMTATTTVTATITETYVYYTDETSGGQLTVQFLDSRIINTTSNHFGLVVVATFSLWLLGRDFLFGAGILSRAC
jgi:hypothetical protein